MAVYVDDTHQVATLGRVTATWSHLTADTSTELHRFARQLGLRPAWARPADRGGEHYPVTATARRLALRLGAQSTTDRSTHR